MMDPILDAQDIQGNIIPGFGRAEQFFVALQSSNPDQLRAALQYLKGKVTNLAEAMSHKADRKAAFIAGAPPPTLEALWLNVALGAEALRSLGVTSIERKDLAFQAGMIPSRTGDCTRDSLPDRSPNLAHPNHWQVGGPNARVDMLCIFASSRDASTASAPTIAGLEAAGLKVIFRQLAQLLTGNTEHFGFVDGISIPGPRGVAEVDGEMRQVTTRYGIPLANGREFGKPGQLLADPAQFVFHNDSDAAIRNGSFLVLRRLTQDVRGFYTETASIAQMLSAQLQSPITDAQLRAHIVGRWPSGQPLMRPIPDPAKPEKSMALNHFNFLIASPAIVLNDETQIPPSASDPDPTKGLLCPVWAHIRKVNPRDLPTNLGGPDDTASFQMLRRGVPFGPIYDHVNPNAPQNFQERGLMFVAYQTSISRQFENLNSNWMNSANGPAPGGNDLLVGQSLFDGIDSNKVADFNQSAGLPTIPFNTMTQWVTPTGGAYLFSPGISALDVMASNRLAT